MFTYHIRNTLSKHQQHYESNPTSGVWLLLLYENYESMENKGTRQLKQSDDNVPKHRNVVLMFVRMNHSPEQLVLLVLLITILLPRLP